MQKILDKVEVVKKIILRGCDNYEDFLTLLKNTNVPINDFETFVSYMVNCFYIYEDFYAILKIIKDNLDNYENYDAENIVFRDILKEIFEDYINFTN